MNEASVGIGLENSKKRLEILYGDKASLDIKQEGELVRVLIKIRYE